MLSLTYDIATDKITGDAMPAISQAAVVTRGGARKIRITLKEDGEKRPLAAGEYLRVIFNGAKTFDADPCAFSADLTIADLVTDETNVYEVTVSYYTDGLNELLGIDGSTGNDKPTADLLGGIILFSAADAEMATSENFAITFNNNTARADVDVPDPIIAGAAVRYFADITGLTGGGSTKLDGIATLNRTARYLVTIVIDDGLGNQAPQQWLLLAGTTAAVSGAIVRPTDYNASTNAKFWQRIS